MHTYIHAAREQLRVYEGLNGNARYALYLTEHVDIHGGKLSKEIAEDEGERDADHIRPILARHTPHFLAAAQFAAASSTCPRLRLQESE